MVRLALILTFLFSQFCFGQGIVFEHYNDANGLSHNSVRHIVQDKNGFLWLGTFSGLNRFDGYEFKWFKSSFAEDREVYDDDITALEYDSERNHLWIGTRNGLALFNLHTHVLRMFAIDNTDPNSLQDEEVRSVHLDRYGQIWVGTKNKGLFIYYPEQDIFEKIEIQGFDYIKEIYEDSKGQIWVGSFGSAGAAKILLDNRGAIAKINTYTLKITDSKEINPYINFIYEDHKSDIFLGSRRGLYKLNQQSDNFENLYIEDSRIRDKLGPYFNSIAKAPDGKYWLGTLGGILVTENLEDITQQKYQWYYSELSNDNSLADNLISALYFDASGVLWICTGDGLDKYDPYKNQFRYNTDISNFLENQVPLIRGFSQTYDNKIIVATRHNGLFISEKEPYSQSGRRISPVFNDENDIASIYSIDGRTFYCGLWNGQVLIYDYLKNTSRTVDVGLGEAPILAFTDLEPNRMIIGSHGKGAIILNTETLEPVKSAGTLFPNSEINQIATNNRGDIWYATQAGAIRYNTKTNIGKTYRHNGKKQIGLPHDNVSDIVIDPGGEVWAATRKGLGYFDVDLDDFVHVSGELYGKWVTDIEPDDKGNLWLNINNNRIARYNTKTKKIKLYHTDSGNRLEVFSLRGFYYADDSEIYLGGKNGIISFFPDDLRENELSPSPVISNVRVQNKEIGVSDLVNGQQILSNDINMSKNLVLENVNKNFSLTFSSPSFVDERYNRYSYMLEGFEDKWNNVDMRQRTVQYTNLFFGDYTFMVKGMNSHGVWSDVSSYEIKILPPFWLSYKAALLLLILLLFIGFLIRRQIKARIALKNQFLMEKIKRERDEKLSNEKLRFFTNISHELRTPLTLILGPAKQLIEQGIESGNQFQKSKSNLIHQNANRLLNLVNQVLDFRRAQSGELRLKVTKTDILLHTRNTFRSFEELAGDKKIHFNIICENENIEGYIDRDKYDKILYNLLSNAIKFTSKFGHVDLFVSLHEEAGKSLLILEVSDDGIGIPLESQQKIFTRFYQAANSKENNTGTGIGLSLVKALVELHKGEIEVQSEPHKGSVFTVKLHIGSNAYKKDEIFEYEQNQKVKESPQLITAKKIIRGVHLKERILIVEDNAELRSYLRDYLSDYYKIFEAENGLKALEVCRSVQPILCVADIMMPEMDGLQFCNALKNDTNISHIPIILLTALSDSDDKIRGYTSGADGYLVKPFDPSLLKTRIENIIKSRMELKRKFSGEIESEVFTLTHSPMDELFMKKVIQLIHENMGSIEMKASFLCRKLGMSSSKLYRKIKELTDLAPNEFIRTVRLKKSAQLLRTKKYNVSEVTDIVGFSDPLYFSRCFKKQFGYPPSQLIK